MTERAAFVDGWSKYGNILETMNLPFALVSHTSCLYESSQLTCVSALFTVARSVSLEHLQEAVNPP
jgi:hypothetical protein